MNKIETFTKRESRFLSNFFPYTYYKYGKGVRYPVKLEIIYEGMVFDCVENAYHAAKTEDIVIRKMIQGMNPMEVVQFAKAGRIPMREDWDEVKLGIMYDLCWQKFQHYKMKRWLLATGDVELVEGNDWGDVFWGVCDGVGENHLGKILMRIREELRAGNN